MDSKTFTSIPLKAVTTIDISGQFYYRIQSFITEYLKDIPEEKMISILRKIQNQDFDDDIQAYNIETLLILLHEIEQKFIDEKKTEEKPIPQEVLDNQGSIGDQLKDME